MKTLRPLVWGLVLVGLTAASGQAAPYAYIGSSDRTIGVLDTSTHTQVATIEVGTGLSDVAVHPAGTFVFAATFGSNSLAIIDTASHSVVATVPVGSGPFAVAVHPAGTRVYVLNAFSESVTVVDPATRAAVATIPVGPYPLGVAVHPAGTFLYVAHDGTDVSVVDTATNTVVATVRAGLVMDSGLRGLAVHPAGTLVYVTNNLEGSLSVINTATNTVVGTVPAGPLPTGVAVHPAGTAIYVTNHITHFPLGHDVHTVSVIDTATHRLVASVPVGQFPAGIAVHPAGTFVYVMNGGSHSVSVIDTTSHEVVATLPWGTGPIAFGQFVGPLSAGLSLTLDGPSFQGGDVLTLMATTYPGDRARHVDVYVELLTPSGARFFLQADGAFTGDRRPLASNWLVTPQSGEILRYTFAGSEPAGTYRWQGYVTEPGTANVIGVTAQATFTFGP